MWERGIIKKDCNILELRFGDHSEFLLWYEDENGKDCVYTLNNKAQAFETESEVHECAVTLGLNCAGACIYDAERLKKWIEAHKKDADCRLLLDFWNMFGDIAYSVGRKFEPVRTKRSDRIYNKLFFGSNLPAMTPPGEEYVPNWTKKERKLLRELMRSGLNMLGEVCTAANLSEVS